ncbi:MFS transporter [Curtobacterium sp. ISL-83]|uniref:MFS transporter n=1 Tax=Curtobacterium sp. ISL-83 TaxID=2819145 RepID=UPI001BE50606|nr:MFS transporter [Curtobacterium sp. ISL-83]MBT2504089.1 MFS transporter [Curtobacterium sp. ISL-83]
MHRFVARPVGHADTVPPATSAAVARRAVRGAVLGNFADQFDIFLPVIALAPVSAALFGANAAWGTGWVFVATLLGRPVGAAVFGPAADRFGRSRTTRLVLLGVAICTGCIAVIPGHEVLGMGTIVAVIILRFIGGVFLGGEYTAAVPLAMEWSQPHQRPVLSGLIMAMSPLANAVIAGTVTLLLATAGPAAYAEGLWRVLFLAGAVIAVITRAAYARTLDPQRDEPAAQPVRSAAHRRERGPLHEVLLGADRGAFVRLFALMSGLWVLTDMAVPVFTGRLSVALASPQAVAMVLLIATAVSAVGIFGAGLLSRRVGYRRFFSASGILAAIAAPIAFAAILGRAGADGIVTVVVLAALLQLVTVSGYGPVAAHLSEQFPAGSRSTGYGLAYSLSIVIPALYPYYLPPLEQLVGATPAVASLMFLGGVLVAVGGLLQRQHRRLSAAGAARAAGTAVR